MKPPLSCLVRIRAVIEQNFHYAALVSQGRIHEGCHALPIRFVRILAAPESLSEDLGSILPDMSEDAHGRLTALTPRTARGSA